MRISDPVSSFYSTGLKYGPDFNQTLLHGVQRVRRYQMEQIDAALPGLLSLLSLPLPAWWGRNLCGQA